MIRHEAVFTCEEKDREKYESDWIVDLKVGDIVICVKEPEKPFPTHRDWGKKITKGKEYKIMGLGRTIDKITVNLIIMCDRGWTDRFDVLMFRTREEMRNERLSSLLD